MKQRQSSRNQRSNKPYKSLPSNNNGQKARHQALKQMEKYIGVAKDCIANGDRITAEYYFQHADHFYRLAQSLVPPPAPEPMPAPVKEDSVPLEKA